MFKKKYKDENILLKKRIEELEKIICVDNHIWRLAKVNKINDNQYYICPKCKKILIVPILEVQG